MDHIYLLPVSLSLPFSRVCTEPSQTWVILALTLGSPRVPHCSVQDPAGTWFSRACSFPSSCPETTSLRLPTGRCPVVPQCLGCRHRTHTALNTLVSKLIPSSVSVQSSLPARLLALVFPKPKLAQPGQAEPAHSKQ